MRFITFIKEYMQAKVFNEANEYDFEAGFFAISIIWVEICSSYVERDINWLEKNTCKDKDQYAATALLKSDDE